MAKKWLACCGIGCASALVGGIAIVFVVYKTSGFGRSVSNCEEMMAKAKAAGLPMESSDLVKHIGDDPSKNLATYSEKYTSLLDRNHDLARKEDQFRSQLSREQEGQTIRNNLKGIDVLVRLAEKASKSTYFEGVTDWDANTFADYSRDIGFGGAKSFVTILVGRARAEMLAGASAKAFADFYRAEKISMLVRDEPSLVALLVRIGCEISILHALEISLCQQVHSNTLLEQSKVFLDHIGPLAEPVASAKAEFLVDLSACRNMRSLSEVNDFISNGKLRPVKISHRTGIPSTLMGKALASGLIECWLDLLLLSKKPMNDKERLDAYRAFDQKVRGKKGWEYTFAKSLLHIYSPAQDLVLRTNAQLACVKALVQVLQYRARHHRLPSNIVEAGVKVVDPYTGKPLTMTSDAYSVSIYSFGPNMADDHGVAKSSTTGENYDIVAVCPLVK